MIGREQTFAAKLTGMGALAGFASETGRAGAAGQASAYLFALNLFA
jgi:hypothetical protein